MKLRLRRKIIKIFVVAIVIACLVVWPILTAHSANEESSSEIPIPTTTTGLELFAEPAPRSLTIEVVESNYQKTQREEEAKRIASQKLLAKNAPRAPKLINNASSNENVTLGQKMAADYGWTGDQWSCLLSLWHKESGWRTDATNGRTWGIPQSLPGNKMAAAGADWKTNPATQISWGLGYIKGRYGSPCAAWNHSERHNWY